MRTSDSISEIAKALNGFQAEIENPPKTADNPFFKSKYTPLADLIKHCRPTLAKHGLSVFQSASGDGEKVSITTLLMHTSGEWIESCPLYLTPQKKDPQGMGGAITYGCRYSYSAALCVASEDDDDGNHASKPEQKPAAKVPPKTPAQKSPTDKVGMATIGQIKAIQAAADKAGLTTDAVKETLDRKYDVKDPADLTHEEAKAFIMDLQKGAV